MAEIKKERNSSIELLRILAIMGVVLLHYNYTGTGNALGFATSSKSVFLLNTVESMAICAVDLFIIISGYFLSSTNKRSLSKITFLILEMSLLSGISYIVLVLLNQKEFSKRELISSFISLGYFIVLYSITYVISPLINSVIERMTEKNLRKTIIVIFVLFSVYSILIDVFSNKEFLKNHGWASMSSIGFNGSDEGFTIVNFLMCYFIGAFLRKSDIKFNKKSILLILYIIDTLLIVAWYYTLGGTAWNYNNPLVILSAVLLFMIFENIHFKSKTVNELAKAGFTCYIIHGPFLKQIFIKFHAKSQLYILIPHMIASAVLIYLISYVVYKIYSLLVGWLERWASPKIDKVNLSFFD